MSRLLGWAGRVERGEALTGAELFEARREVERARERVRRARAAGCEVGLSPHLERLCEAVGR